MKKENLNYFLIRKIPDNINKTDFHYSGFDSRVVGAIHELPLRLVDQQILVCR
jgi:hypothetical protein